MSISLTNIVDRQLQLSDSCVCLTHNHVAARAPIRCSFGMKILREALELLFFSYRDFTGEADAVLDTYGFGRAHHRIIYFVGANEGISVGELCLF